MKDQKKAKWVLGTSGVVLSALLLTQMNDGSQSETNNNQLTAAQEKQMSKKERELVKLDWTNFEIESVEKKPVHSDRKTRRS
ncbi:hypothetical protein JFL43_21835 [Viridibacillus sp. YIM B01967]|uniref:Uncharacterized protein n=1 Tax=Viridibacillus soli TaxID=2798301 RepID=A0ABS1HEH9_9BACL|nr:hypothetical protein [Viridibacillus soli]MBK3497403.1 hypothetical protein [Viridibacillus soli]